MDCFPLSFALRKCWDRDGGDDCRLAARREGDLCIFGGNGRMWSLLRHGAGFVVSQLTPTPLLCPKEPFAAVQSHWPFVEVCDGRIANNLGSVASPTALLAFLSSCSGRPLLVHIEGQRCVYLLLRIGAGKGAMLQPSKRPWLGQALGTEDQCRKEDSGSPPPTSECQSPPWESQRA